MVNREVGESIWDMLLGAYRNSCLWCSYVSYHYLFTV